MQRLFFLLTIVAWCAIPSVLVGQDVNDLTAQGDRHVSHGNYADALEAYNEALKLDPTSENLYSKRAFTFSLLKQYEQAVSDYSTLIEMKPTLISAYLSRGSAFNKLERFKEALQDFNKVIELDPQNSEAFNNRGWSKKGMGDKEGACQDWKTSKKMGNSEAKIILKNNQC